jgi:hypothetical protein
MNKNLLKLTVDFLFFSWVLQLCSVWVSLALRARQKFVFLSKEIFFSFSGE